MDLSTNGLSKSLGLGLVVSAALTLSACGGSSSRTTNPDNTGTPTPAPTTAPTPAPTPAPTAEPTPAPTTEPTPAPTTEPPASAKVSGPLDPVQDEVIDGILVAQVGDQLPSPLSGTVACAASALNFLVDVPDAILLGAEGLADGADPFASFNEGQASVQAALTAFAGQLQSTLVQLSGRGDCDPNAEAAPSATNPLAGTPLEPVGAAILALGAGLDESSDDPNLTSVTATLAPLVDDVATALNGVATDTADVPALGAVFAALAGAATDVAVLLPNVGNYDGNATAATTATLVENLLNNILLGALPVGDVDAATGQDFSGDIADGIAALSSVLGDTIGEVVTPLFNQGLDGALSPILDPVEGLLALILHPSELDVDSGLWAATSPLVDPLQGALAGAAGDGNLSFSAAADTLLALLIGNQGNLSLSEVLAGFALTPAANGSNYADALTLVDAGNALQVDGSLGDILDLTTGIFALDLQDALEQVTGDLINDFLNGLL